MPPGDLQSQQKILTQQISDTLFLWTWESDLSHLVLG